MKLSFTHSISVENYNKLRASVDFIQVVPKRAEVALKNSLYICVAILEDTPIGMIRVVGDGGYVYFICDVVVNPAYQSKGIGRRLIDHALSYIEGTIEEGETVMVNLMSAMNKEPFYEKLGFHKRPFGNHGAGMSCWLTR